MQTTAAGPRVVTGPDADRAKEQTAARANATYEAEQKRRAGMTDQQRWSEDFNNHLSDQAGAGRDQYNFAYDNFTRDLDDAVARGTMTSQQAAKARQHIINSVRDQQRAWHSNYLTTYNNGDHTDSDRQGIRGSRIWATHGDNGLVHFRHGDFSENTTFGGAERGYARRDARSARTANPSTGNPNVNSTSQPAQAASTQTTSYSPKLVRRDRNGRVAPTVFKGGYAVDTGNGVDWSAKGDGHINISGANFTDEQYAAYNNVRSSLTTAIRQQEGVSLNEARARATALANQWAADQSQVAAGGKAFNRWQHVDTPAPVAKPQPTATPQPTAAPQSVAQSPVTALGATDIASVAGTPSNRPLTLGGEPTLGLPTSTSDRSLLNNPGLAITLPSLGAAQPQQLSSPSPEVTPAPATAPTTSNTTPAAPAAAPATAPAAGSTTEEPPVESPAWDFRSRALENRNKVADGLVPIKDYEGIYYKPGDMSGTLYKSNGEPWRTRGGNIVDAKILRADTNWFGANGNDIKHNIEQRYQEDSAKAFTPEEAAVLGFKPLPGAPGYYINSRGEIVDEFGYAEDEGTLPSDVDHSTWDDIRKAWREWVPDYFGDLFSGDSDDYK